MADPTFEPILAIGMMSGTSADGVDAALIRTDGEAYFEFLHAITLTYDQSVRDRLLEAAQRDFELTELMLLERELTVTHAAACDNLLAEAVDLPREKISLAGFHGHTIRHVARSRLTWQIGDASLLSSRLGCPVVHDFRRRDLAAGGQGAPLAPLFHRMLFSDDCEHTVILNLGGVANITYLGPDGSILAGDTGPGCGLLDEWAQKHLGEKYDRDGQLARTGSSDLNLVRKALAMPFFQCSLPKSADRFEFSEINLDDLTAADGAATLCAITVAGVRSVVDRLPNRPASIWVTGGGSRHPGLMSMLADEFENVQPIEAAGYRSDSLEAECFAWLAVRRLRNLPTSLPETTGCSEPVCGGSVTS